MRQEKSIAIDLFCGLGGWAEGFLAEDYEVIGFDIERHDYGTGGYPGHLVLQNVLTICGEQFRKIAHRIVVVVASPPCTEYSYMAMPWRRAKQIARALRGEDEFPADYKGNCSPRRWDEREVQRLCDATKSSGLKNPGHIKKRDGHSHTHHLTNPAEHIKQGGDWFGKDCETSMSRLYGSKSTKRKAASAQIAKIPFALANHVAKCFFGELYR
jgi:site-specific DNA-cytosine methylase